MSRKKTPESQKRKSPPPHVKFQLTVDAGGRCEFEGCNKYLLEDPITLRGRNLSEKAHIYPVSQGGPRGNEAGRPEDINSIENLMLLCPECHGRIDAEPKIWNIDRLIQMKKNHEDRIRYLTGLGPEIKTNLLILKAQIGGRVVETPFEELTDAITPLYPVDRGFVIDLTSFGDESSNNYYPLAEQRIRQKMQQFYDAGVEENVTKHVSVFALAPIPLLITLGECISDKINTSFFQRHRGADKPWKWQKEGEPIRYTVRQAQEGTDREKVALLLSLSGRIDPATLPKVVDDQFYIYEITLDGVAPDPGFLKREEDLTEFKRAYREILSKIMADHGQIKGLHLFPAVPAPIAVLCGHLILPKIHPEFFIYDNDRVHGGFQFKIKVNHHEQRRLSA